MLNLSGKEPAHMWGIWPLLPSSPSGIWPRIWVLGWLHLLFYAEEWDQLRHIVPCACLCASHLAIEVVWLNPERPFSIEVSICFYIYTKTLLLTTHFQYKLMKYLTLWGLLIISTRVFVRKSSAGRWGLFNLIWSNFGIPRWGFWPKILLKSQMPHICLGSPLPLGLTLIDA